MTHFIRSRRRRQVAPQLLSCSIALLSFRLNDAHGVDASAEPLLLPVSASFVADTFGSVSAPLFPNRTTSSSTDSHGIRMPACGRPLPAWKTR